MKEYHYISMFYEHLHVTTWSYQWFKASVIQNREMLSLVRYIVLLLF